VVEEVEAPFEMPLLVNQNPCEISNGTKVGRYWSFDLFKRCPNPSL